LESESFFAGFFPVSGDTFLTSLALLVSCSVFFTVLTSLTIDFFAVPVSIGVPGIVSTCVLCFNGAVIVLGAWLSPVEVALFEGTAILRGGEALPLTALP